MKELTKEEFKELATEHSKFHKGRIQMQVEEFIASDKKYGMIDLSEQANPYGEVKRIGKQYPGIFFKAKTIRRKGYVLMSKEKIS